MKRVFRWSFVVLTAYALLQLWSINSFGHDDRKRTADCAIVLGAAAYHKNPSPVFRERINHAVELYHEGRVKMLIFTGGYGKGAEYAESEVGRIEALRQSIPSHAIVIERSSDNTVENLREAANLMEVNNLKSALIVSDPWHLKLACAMADDVGIDAAPSATPTTAFKSKSNRLKFLFKEFYQLHHYYAFGS